MAFVNPNYLKLKAGYLFPEIARRVRAFQMEYPSAKIIRMGLSTGDDEWRKCSTSR